MGHPSSCHDPDCTLTYREHLLSVGIASSALPTRKRAVAGIEATERRWDVDMDAYKRMRGEGLDVPFIDGARYLEQTAETAEQVATAKYDRASNQLRPIAKPAAFEAFGETFGHSATEPAVGT